MKNIIIRPAEINDCSAVLKLIQELADHENVSTSAKLDLQTFQEDGFGKEAFYKCFVAEHADTECTDATGTVEAKEIVGYVLYNHQYSTFIGKSIFMQDIYVAVKHRNKGIGEKLWRTIVKEALKQGCARVDFMVLGSNSPVMEFYKKRGAVDFTSTDDWHYFRMQKEEMVSFSRTSIV